MEKSFSINININISAVVRVLGALVTLCIAMAILRGLVIFTTGNYAKDGLWMLFNMDLEQTLPTYVSTINLFLVSALLALVSLSKKSTGDSYWKHWSILSLIFLFLSIDESISLHEVFVKNSFMNLLNISGPTHFGAGILILSCALVGGLFFLKFLLHLPNKTKVRFIFSGFIFVMGAAGMEALGGYILSDGYEGNQVAYNTGVIIEESLEMAGILFFIRAVLYYIHENMLNATPFFEEVRQEPAVVLRSLEPKARVQEEQFI